MRASLYRSTRSCRSIDLDSELRKLHPAPNLPKHYIITLLFFCTWGRERGNLTGYDLLSGERADLTSHQSHETSASSQR